MATVILNAGGGKRRFGAGRGAVPAAGRRLLLRLRPAVTAPAAVPLPPGSCWPMSKAPSRSCDQALEHGVETLAAGQRRPQMRGVDLEQAADRQRRQPVLASAVTDPVQ